MKKSTLITTIAMIVVVVVALSTATYAWFSSNTYAIATTDMSTNASADFVLYQGTVTTPASESVTTATASFTETSTDTVNLKGIEVGTGTFTTNGLWAPTARIATSMRNNSVGVENIALPSYYEAKIQTKGDVKSNYVTKAPVAGTPDVIRVANASGSDKGLVLTVVVNAGTIQTTGSLYAAVATSFVVDYVKSVGGDEAVGAIVTNGYKYQAATAEGNEVKTPTTEPGTGFTYSAGKSCVSWDTSTGEKTYTRPDYKDATVKNGVDYKYFKKTAANEKLGITATDYYLSYTIDLGTLGATDYITLALYTWIDGFVAESFAANAKYKITYAFTSYAVTQAASSEGQGTI